MQGNNPVTNLDNQQPTSYYKVLKIAPWATAQDVRRAYRELSKLYHPDTTTLPEAIATTKFQQLNEAYGTLSSPDKRTRYDLEHGYSRFSGVKPLRDLEQPVNSSGARPFTERPFTERPFTGYPFNHSSKHGGDRFQSKTAYLDPNDRPLSPGELFAVLLLGLTFAGCIALVILVGLFRGEIALPADTLLIKI
ncbi:MAG: J domain-containing protein [Cyanothece sp. SIO2G6]|nr:J domain-containing protein [Cyanothece sp. SIO2G6]